MSYLESRIKKYALYLLGRRAYSEHEMKEKLSNKIKSIQKRNVDGADIAGADGSEIVASTASYLKSLALLDDEAYAKTLADSLLRQNKSSRTIEMKLKQKGIDKEVFEKVFSKDETKESDSLSKLLDSKLRNSPDMLSSKKGKEKLIRFLLYRGFSYSDIKKKMEEK